MDTTHTSSRAHTQTDQYLEDSSSNIETISARLTQPDLSNKGLGQLGEDYVCLRLQSLGWQILDRNWGTRFGELDIVALDISHWLRFIEVKTRRSRTFGLPEEAVSSGKQTRLRRAALQWLVSHDQQKAYRNRGSIFDVAAVSVSSGRSRTAQVSLHYIQEAF